MLIKIQLLSRTSCLSRAQQPHAGGGSCPASTDTDPLRRGRSAGAALCSGCLRNPALFPALCLARQPPEKQPQAPGRRQTAPSRFTETAGRQASWAGRTYLCRPPPRRGGRWPPTPAKWLAARPPKCPASPWHPGAGQRRPPPSACLRAESKGREEGKEAVTAEKTQTHDGKPGSVSGETCGPSVTPVNYPQLSRGGSPITSVWRWEVTRFLLTRVLAE